MGQSSASPQAVLQDMIDSTSKMEDGVEDDEVGNDLAGLP